MNKKDNEKEEGRKITNCYKELKIENKLIEKSLRQPRFGKSFLVFDTASYGEYSKTE